MNQKVFKKVIKQKLCRIQAQHLKEKDIALSSDPCMREKAAELENEKEKVGQVYAQQVNVSVLLKAQVQF